MFTSSVIVGFAFSISFKPVIPAINTDEKVIDLKTHIGEKPAFKKYPGIEYGADNTERPEPDYLVYGKVQVNQPGYRTQDFNIILTKPMVNHFRHTGVTESDIRSGKCLIFIHSLKLSFIKTGIPDDFISLDKNGILLVENSVKLFCIPEVSRNVGFNQFTDKIPA